MRRRSVRLLALHAAVLAALSPLATLAFATPTNAAQAQAAQAFAAGPTAVRLSGPGLSGPVTFRATDDPGLFEDLLSEVDWLASRPANAPTPDPAGLGPKYQLAVLVEGKPSQVYDLYPLAVGGPRVFRPAAQPGRKATAAWLYGRVSMPETLRQAGVPLVITGRNQPGTKENSATGGQGGGTGQGAVGAVGSAAPDSGLASVLREWQRGTLLVGAGAFVLLLMLAGVSFLVRKAS